MNLVFSRTPGITRGKCITGREVTTHFKMTVHKCKDAVNFLVVYRLNIYACPDTGIFPCEGDRPDIFPGYTI